MTQDQVDRLLKRYVLPNDDKLDKSIASLKRMATFYEEKAPDSKDGGALFYSFSKNLHYACTIMVMHQHLVSEIREARKEQS